MSALVVVEVTAAVATEEDATSGCGEERRGGGEACLLAWMLSGRKMEDAQAPVMTWMMMRIKKKEKETKKMRTNATLKDREDVKEWAMAVYGFDLFTLSLNVLGKDHM
ncbi:hypothetical protein D9C73_007484 [Collichthys lucidus]|uniref:Uncharacterized protein n=1 Tax=Collichthys lucidus TaxID=240159 RepID=A0A4U5UIS6_COLLU|nr:hypothetical protein D9C73_007484 [Collichthys lucidus]